MTTSYDGQLTPKQQAAYLALLWPYLKRDSAHKGRRQTGYGTKTQAGLLACLESIVRPKVDVAGAIAGMLDGTEWTIDTLDEIADVLHAAGYQVRDSAQEDSE